MIVKDEKRGKIRISINLWKLLIYISIIVLIANIIIWFLNNKSNADISSEINDNSIENKLIKICDKEIETVEADFNKLKEKNADIKAWIKVNNTNINYPVVQANNNSFYLTHNLYKEQSSAGWIFADYRNNLETLDKNTILYGHNRLNDTMFAELENTLNADWYENENNKYITFNTEYKDYIGEIISAYKIKASDFIVSNYYEENEFINYIESIKNRSIYDFNTEVNANDKIITLYTCDDTSEYRIIVQAKLIEK